MAWLPLPNPNQAVSQLPHAFDLRSQILNRILQGQLAQQKQQIAQQAGEREAEMQPYNIRLKESQIKAQNAAAEKASMIADILYQAMGIPKSSSTNIPTKNNQNIPTSLSESNKNGISSVSPDEQQRRAKELAYQFGLLKETPSEVESREGRTAFTKELAKADADQLKDWQKTVSTSNQLEPVYENILSTLANPTLQAMYQNPEYLGYDIAYLKRMGTPEQQKLLATLGADSKQLYQSMAGEFKGAFREFEKKLFDKAILEETSDTLMQMIGKTNAAYALKKLGTQRLLLADKIVRDSGGKISPGSALEIAKRQINGQDITKDIENKFNQMQKELKAIHKIQGLPPKSNKSILIDPQGGEHYVNSSEVENALKKYPNFKIKGQK